MGSTRAILPCIVGLFLSAASGIVHDTSAKERTEAPDDFDYAEFEARDSLARWLLALAAHMTDHAQVADRAASEAEERGADMTTLRELMDGHEAAQP